jgi:thioesterase domain-containing protein
MKTQQPAGPYRLIGYSYGGVVAYEMARILLARGEDVSSLMLLDSIAPSVMRFSDEITEIVDWFRELTGDVNLAIDLERLRQSSDQENARYLVGLLNDRGLPEINAEHLASAMIVSRANRLCYRTYAPARLSRAIDASLYRATQGVDFGVIPADYGWSELLRGAVRIHDVEATHYTILLNLSERGLSC